MASAPIRFRSHVRAFDGDSWHYLEVPRAVFEKLGGQFRLRLICGIAGKLEFHCALMPKGKGAACILVSKQKLRQADLRAGDAVQLTVRRDTSRFGMKMPKELSEALKQNPSGKKRFLKLTAGKQRNIIHFVDSVKNPDTRVSRAVQILEDLETLPEGKESMQELWKLASDRGKAERAKAAAPPVVGKTARDEEFLSRFLPIGAAPKAKGARASK